jgi:hypothetical protein
MSKKKSKEERAEYMRNWRKNHESSKNRISDTAHTNWMGARKRAEKFGGKVETDPELIKAMKNLYKLASQMNEKAGKKIYCVDHVVELAYGGDHVLSNLRLTTISDNSKKYQRIKKEMKTRPVSQPDDLITR